MAVGNVSRIVSFARYGTHRSDQFCFIAFNRPHLLAYISPPTASLHFIAKTGCVMMYGLVHQQSKFRTTICLPAPQKQQQQQRERSASAAGGEAGGSLSSSLTVPLSEVACPEAPPQLPHPSLPEVQQEAHPPAGSATACAALTPERMIFAAVPDQQLAAAAAPAGGTVAAGAARLGEHDHSPSQQWAHAFKMNAIEPSPAKVAARLSAQGTDCDEAASEAHAEPTPAGAATTTAPPEPDGALLAAAQREGGEVLQDALHPPRAAPQSAAAPAVGGTTAEPLLEAQSAQSLGDVSPAAQLPPLNAATAAPPVKADTLRKGCDRSSAPADRLSRPESQEQRQHSSRLSGGVVAEPRTQPPPRRPRPAATPTTAPQVRLRPSLAGLYPAPPFSLLYRTILPRNQRKHPRVSPGHPASGCA